MTPRARVFWTNTTYPQHKAKKKKKITGAGKGLALVGVLPEREPRGLAWDQLHLDVTRSWLSSRCSVPSSNPAVEDRERI